MTKFQKAIKGHKYGIQLFSSNAGERPFGNDTMRRIFGPMCDAPSPKEYIDAQSTNSDAIEQVTSAVNHGLEAMIGVVCRTIKGAKPPALLCIKPIKSKKSDIKHLYRWVIGTPFIIIFA